MSVGCFWYFTTRLLAACSEASIEPLTINESVVLLIFFVNCGNTAEIPAPSIVNARTPSKSAPVNPAKATVTFENAVEPVTPVSDVKAVS